MIHSIPFRRICVGAKSVGLLSLGLLSLGLLLLSVPVHAQLPQPTAQKPREQLKQPVFKVANNNNNNTNATPETRNKPHPLDSALKIAHDSLKKSRENIKDYTAVIVKREQVNGVVGGYEYMFAKIRNRQVENGVTVTPFSVYLNFLKPATIKGREVLYVEGKNNGKMFAHEGTGVKSLLPSVWIRPNGPIAMQGNRYPLTEIGIENLVVRLVEKGERDRQWGECEVTYRENATINKRKCTLLQVKHPVSRPHFEFHIAQIFIDNELGVPIRYAAYSWPTQAGNPPQLMEEYTYLNVKVNAGLKDADFDPQNPNYNF